MSQTKLVQPALKIYIYRHTHTHTHTPDFFQTLHQTKRVAAPASRLVSHFWSVFHLLYLMSTQAIFAGK